MRNPQVNIICGAKGHGKSTVAARLLEMHPSGNALVYKEGLNVRDPAFKKFRLVPFASYRGGRAIINGADIPYKAFMRALYDHYRNGAVMIDDTALYERNDPSDELTKLAIMCRHGRIDLLLAFHSLQAIPVRLLQYVNNVILFHTTDDRLSKLKAFPDADRFIQAKERIAKKVAAGNKFYCERIKLSD